MIFMKKILLLKLVTIIQGQCKVFIGSFIYIKHILQH